MSRRRLLRLFARRVWFATLGLSSARWFLFTLVVQAAVGPLLGLLVWSVALPRSRAILPYYVALFAVQLATASYENYTFSYQIYDGSLNQQLLAPQPVVVGPLGENLALRLWHLALGIPLVLLSAALVGARFDPLDIAVAIPALLLAAALRFLFTYTLALSAFWTPHAYGLVTLGSTAIFLLGGGAAPVSLLPGAAQVVSAALPFRAMLGLPAEIATGGLNTLQVLEGLALQAFWVVLLGAVAAGSWRLGLRRYTSVGGAV